MLKPNSAINTHGANILIEQLYKFYGDVKVLEDLDLNIQAGICGIGSQWLWQKHPPPPDCST